MVLGQPASAILVSTFKVVKIHTFAHPISSISGVLLVLILCLHFHTHTQSMPRHQHHTYFGWVNMHLSNAIRPPCYPCLSGAIILKALRTVFCCLHTVSTVIRDYGYYTHQWTVFAVSFFLFYPRPPSSLPFIREQTED